MKSSSFCGNNNLLESINKSEELTNTQVLKNDGIGAPNKERESNMELLRIIAMLLVLIVHANFLSLGVPVKGDLEKDFCSTFFRLCSESIAIVCVNVFVLISGWFGVHPKLSKILEFCFQVLCVEIIVYIAMLFMGKTDMMGKSEWVRYFFFSNYWFVRAYIILYFFTPILNIFVNQASKRTLEIFLFVFFLWQTIRESVVTIVGGTNFFGEGQTPISFMGLYVLARYLRIYPIHFIKHIKFHYWGYIVMTLAITLFAVLWIYIGRECWDCYKYDSPFVILASVSLLLFFSRMSIKSKVINWIATSCFAVYVVHCSPFLFPIYLGKIREWFQEFPIWNALLHTTIWILVFFICYILIDKIRIILWNAIKRIIESLSFI